MPFALQIGAYDGITGDPLFPMLKACPELTAWRFEPEPEAFAKLAALHDGDTQVKCFPQAVTADDHPRPMWKFDTRQLTLQPSQVWVKQTTSFHSYLNTMAEHPSAVISFQPECISLAEVCRTCPPIDILIIDTEGYDHTLLKAFPWDEHQPRYLHYEHKHMTPPEKHELTALLEGLGYTLRDDEYDTYGWRSWTFRTEIFPYTFRKSASVVSVDTTDETAGK